jgi:hypothetical protein
VVGRVVVMDEEEEYFETPNGLQGVGHILAQTKFEVHYCKENI